MEMIDSSHSLDKEKIHGLTVNRNRNYLAKKMIWRPNILACNDPDTWKIFDLFYANMQFFHTALLGKQSGNILYKIYLATGEQLENETQNVVCQTIMKIIILVMIFPMKYCIQHHVHLQQQLNFLNTMTLLVYVYT